MQNRARSAGYCESGEHDFQLGIVQTQFNLFQVANTGIVYCAKCPFHYFPKPFSQDETHNREHSISDD